MGLGSKDEDIFYSGIGYKSGAVYLSAKEKEMISEMIEMYYTTAPTNNQEDELISKIRTKIEK